MTKVLVIPDVHLKTVMFDRAEKILESGQADFAVQLGDLFDDWDMQFAVAFYEKTAKRVIAFQKKFPKTLWCVGNHDFGYCHPEYGRKESGHSKIMEDTMTNLLAEMCDAGIEQEVVHIMDGVIFSHAGVTDKWVKRQATLTAYDEAIDGPIMCKLANYATTNELWDSDSPIWVRPQEDYNSVTGERIAKSCSEMWEADRFMQVVGHTPMRKITKLDNFLSTDVFSTYNNGAPYGEQRFAIVDTINKTWRYAEEEL